MRPQCALTVHEAVLHKHKARHILQRITKGISEGQTLQAEWKHDSRLDTTQVSAKGTTGL